MQVSVYNTQGAVVGQLDLDERVFAVPMNEAIVHQALVRQQANARVGTASTKTRSNVSGSGRKLYRQKHTGRARAGDLRSPLRRHGGITFGPHPRSYRQQMPKKMRRLAIRCLLSAKVSDGELKVIDKLEMSEPKTRDMISMLQTLGIDRSALIALSSPNASVVRSASNVKGAKIIQARLLNVLDLLTYGGLIITADAVRVVEGLWGGESRCISTKCSADR
ncbi:MAG: 50S ribosomal protein L4 [Dehalococcoidia bacterium]|nr:50S ribosomal protein L4 [Chloroflexota bacterium]MBT9159459.1 50S ribosomal protein L4 [Chloroflexota bacterium]MBT9161623.1 50S ribosomal protein L4 [Chloroflexota bacterium]